MNLTTTNNSKKKSLNNLLGVAMGVLSGTILGLAHYGLFKYFGKGEDNLASLGFSFISISFLVGVPMAIGFVTVWFSSLKSSPNLLNRLFLPWLSIGVFYVAVLVIKWEGMICLAICTPIFLGFSTLGGALAGSLRTRTISKPRQNMALVLFILLPLLSSPLEGQRGSQLQERYIHTEILIEASPMEIWEQIGSFPAITESEHHFSFFHAIGIPKPKEALLDHQGIGGIRTARFEKGIEFQEKIILWDPGKRLEFTLATDPDSIPPNVLDDHVKVGSPFFDVLRGAFRIESLGPKLSRLHLESKHRVSTQFNLYASFWTDWIMADIQNYLLRIIKQRSEHPTSNSQNFSQF